MRVIELTIEQVPMPNEKKNILSNTGYPSIFLFFTQGESSDDTFNSNSKLKRLPHCQMLSIISFIANLEPSRKPATALVIQSEFNMMYLSSRHPQKLRHEPDPDLQKVCSMTQYTKQTLSLCTSTFTHTCNTLIP